MIRKIILAASFFSALAVMGSPQASADHPSLSDIWAYDVAQHRPWHGSYYHQQYGQPLALVVPPTAHMRQTFSWGVSQNLNHAIHHQFGRSATQPGAARPGSFYATPPWPSHTDQFGVYYVRGPW